MSHGEPLYRLIDYEVCFIKVSQISFDTESWESANESTFRGKHSNQRPPSSAPRRNLPHFEQAYMRISNFFNISAALILSHDNPNNP